MIDDLIPAQPATPLDPAATRILRTKLEDMLERARVSLEHYAPENFTNESRGQVRLLRGLLKWLDGEAD